MIDVDQFKKYNDHYGHLAGDACLRQVAIALQGSVRQDLDIVARYGGEEFAVIMPDADLETARLVAERVRRTVVEMAAPHAQSDIGSISVSIGIAASGLSAVMTSENLIHLADGALYDAKRTGRNRVCESDARRFSFRDSGEMPEPLAQPDSAVPELLVAWPPASAAVANFVRSGAG
jgi:diguanylate cyclase (GGDEF)-like protein